MSGDFVYLVTGAIDPGTDRDTNRLAATLRSRGVPTRVVRWSDDTVCWDRARTAVLRSAWDYGRDPAGFRSWIEACGEATRLLNPPPLLDWNLDKRYMIDLEAAGLPVVPTRLVEDPAGTRPERLMAEEGWTSIVVKPTSGNDGRGVHRLESGGGTRSPEGAWTPSAGRPLLVQPYLPSVESAGEVSLIVIDGELSHAVTKTPAPGEFRTQERLGGRVAPAAASEAHHLLVRRVLGFLEETPLYARIDLLDYGGRAVISELELVEPDLYLRLKPRSYDDLARAIARRVES